MGAFLGLAIATRPNLAVLFAVQLLVLFRERRAAWVAVAAPLLAIACALGAYNYARFRSPAEFGVSYQITRLPMRGRSVCSVCTPVEVVRLINGIHHYVYWPPVFHGRFPFVEVQTHRLDPEVSYPGRPEPIAGLLPVTPIVLVGTGLALARRAGRMPALLVLAGWLVMVALSSCWWVTARYTLDFIGLLMAGSILCIEEASPRVRWISALLAVWSIALGLLLPFSRLQLLH